VTDVVRRERASVAGGLAPNLTRAAIVVAGLLGAAAVAAERVLQWMAPAGRPLSGPVRAQVEIDAPIQAVWSVLADIAGQVRWMPEMKRVRMLTPGPIREGSEAEATVRIFGIAVTDRVTITSFQPPTAFGIEHHGLFGGSGRIELRAGPNGDTTVVEWVEHLVPPWLPALGWLLGRPVIGYLYRRDLRLLRDLVEDRPLLVAA
jgi:uncharacterized membrane protein